MAEAIAIVGVVASIAQLIDFSATVVNRLQKFHSDVRELPESLRHIRTELPILSTALHQIQQAVEAGLVGNGARDALVPVIDGCREQIEQLNSILGKTLPPANASWRTKSKMAILSLHQDDKIEKITTSLRNYIATLTFYCTAASSTLQPLTDARLAQIHMWLYAPDPSMNYQKALTQRQDDTGLWFLESNQYAKWKTDAASFLWLHGIPGCGKTILSSTILQNLLQDYDNDPGRVVVYFYFDFNDALKQKAELMLRSLICQLSQQCVKFPANLETLMASCDNGQRQPALHALEEVLQQIIQDFPHVYIVLDALDECSEREGLTTMLELLAAWHLQNLHILLTSRRERDIERSLETFIEQQNIVYLQNELVDKDIQKYVRKRLSHDRSLSKWQKDATVAHDIETALMNGAHGMFRWAVCQLDILGKCRNRAMLRKSLATLPPTLDKTYDRILSAISEDDTQYAVRILRWLTFSARPLSVDEVAELVAIDTTHKPTFNRDEVLEDPLEVLEICSSLLSLGTIETTNEFGSPMPRQIVTLAHYSVREYLLSDRIRTGRVAQYSMQDSVDHDDIARGCIGYLLQFTQQEPLPKTVLADFKLARYSAQFWSDHAKKSGERIKGTSEVAIDLFSTETGTFLNWIRLCDPETDRVFPEYERTIERTPNPLYYAALLGMDEVVNLLVEKGADVNVLGGFYSDALQAASAGDHVQTVRLLLDKGADVNAQGRQHGNALQVASAYGHEKTVKLLLASGAEVNAQGGMNDNALYAATTGGHKQTVKLLLDEGADANAPGGYNGTSLSVASYAGNEEIVKLLLDKGADVNVQGGDRGNALQAASDGGHKQIVRLLLDSGADVNAQGGHYGNALQAATEQGHEQIIELLIDNNADVNAQGGHYHSALHAALVRGNERIVKLLLHRGANINVQGGPYYNTLQAASIGGQERTIKLLLDEGADVNAQGGHYGNALQAASYGGHKHIVKLLLHKGANVNALGGYYGNALQAASYAGYEQTVKLLLDSDVDVNALGGTYSNALTAASVIGHEQIVKLLLDKGADINAQGKDCGTPLQEASFIGDEQIVKLLLNNDADVNAQGGRYGNALQAAIVGGHRQIIKLLLDEGSDVNVQGGFYGNALQAAAFIRDEEIVKLLLNKDADVNAQGGHYGNPLQAAVATGYEKIIKLIIDKGADLNAQGGYYGNALQAAIVGGHRQTIKLLLDEVSDVNVRGGYYGNALQAAAFEGDEEIVKLLLDKGADVNVQGGLYSNPLQAALIKGREQIIKLLLNNDADVNAQGGIYSNALQTALSYGHWQVAKLIIDKGADVNAMDGDCGTALQTASFEGHEQIVRLLLDKGAHVNMQGGLYGYALQAASARGHEKVAKLLLDSGADVNAQDGKYRNALEAASTQGHMRIVKLLLDRGAKSEGGVS